GRWARSVRRERSGARAGGPGATEASGRGDVAEGGEAFVLAAEGVAHLGVPRHPLVELEGERASLGARAPRADDLAVDEHRTRPAEHGPQGPAACGVGYEELAVACLEDEVVRADEPDGARSGAGAGHGVDVRLEQRPRLAVDLDLDDV